MKKTSHGLKSGRLAAMVAVVLVIVATAGGVLAYSYWSRLRELARGPSAEEANAGHDPDEHVGEEYDDHGAGDANSVTLSEAALKNIRYKPLTIGLGEYVRKISMPGIVVERPGKSQVHVSAPLTGIVTRIHVHEGEAIPQGAPLFDLRPTHEDLVTTQSELLATVDALDVVQAELKRLEALTQDVIPGKRILEQKYERQKLEARLEAQRQALRLHGLSDDQIDQVLKTRRLIQTVTIHTPARDETDEHPYHIQSINVLVGQQVTTGDMLCVLADHCELYIEGTAFEADAPILRDAIEAGSPVAADILVSTRREQVVEGLKLLYLAGQVDRESRAQHFYVKLPNEIVSDRQEGSQRFLHWRFSPGQRVELNLPVDKWTERIVAPAAAVVTDGSESYVYRQSDEGFQRVPVHVEHRDRKFAVIKNDGTVLPGDVIAGNGAFQIHLALKNKSGGAIDPHAGHDH